MPRQVESRKRIVSRIPRTRLGHSARVGRELTARLIRLRLSGLETPRRGPPSSGSNASGAATTIGIRTAAYTPRHRAIDPARRVERSRASTAVNSISRETTAAPAPRHLGPAVMPLPSRRRAATAAGGMTSVPPRVPELRQNCSPHSTPAAAVAAWQRNGSGITAVLSA